MKYRIVYNYPNGYALQKSILGIFWRFVTFPFTRDAICTDSVQEAEIEIDALHIYKKPVERDKWYQKVKEIERKSIITKVVDFFEQIGSENEDDI